MQLRERYSGHQDVQLRSGDRVQIQRFILNITKHKCFGRHSTRILDGRPPGDLY